MRYLRVNRAFYNMLKSTLSNVELVYSLGIQRRVQQRKICYHPMGRQTLSMGELIGTQLQELVIAFRSSCYGFINPGLRAGLGILMEDRGLPCLVARLEVAR
jgi:hypothetical protein